MERGEKQVGKRDTLAVTGGKDLGKRKGVAIDYLTGRLRGDFGLRPKRPGPRRPSSVFELSVDGLATWDTNKS